MRIPEFIWCLRASSPLPICNLKSACQANFISYAEANSARSCGKCREKLSDIFHMPSICWEEYTGSANGFFGCETTREAGAEGFSELLISSRNQNMTIHLTQGTHSRYMGIVRVQASGHGHVLLLVKIPCLYPVFIFNGPDWYTFIRHENIHSIWNANEI